MVRQACPPLTMAEIWTSLQGSAEACWEVRRSPRATGWSRTQLALVPAKMTRMCLAGEHPQGVSKTGWEVNETPWKECAVPCAAGGEASQGEPGCRSRRKLPWIQGDKPLPLAVLSLWIQSGERNHSYLKQANFHKIELLSHNGGDETNEGVASEM